MHRTEVTVFSLWGGLFLSASALTACTDSKGSAELSSENGDSGHLEAPQDSADTDSDDPGEPEDTAEDDYEGPRFVELNYLDLDEIEHISLFRSAAGHDYSDDFEDCRTMKHYFWPYGGSPDQDNPSWGEIGIYAPVDGTVNRILEEWAGTQVEIQSAQEPDFFFVLFHVDLDSMLLPGDLLSEGQRLGTHIGPQTMQDIAVGEATEQGWKLHSWFDVITDPVFAEYQERGVATRSMMVISQEEREADPLDCDQGSYTDGGSLEDWLTLD